MALHDRRGLPVSTMSRTALDHYERSAELLLGYYNDPLAAVDAALAEDPDFVMAHCLRGAMMAVAADKTVEPEFRRSVESAEALAARANDRERGHVAALRAWLDGDFAGAVERYSAVLLDHPCDILALQIAHLGDFFLGQSSMLRDRVARVMPNWDQNVPGYGYVLGMHAFGLEETGLYGRAEETGQRALQINPRDPWTIHAVAHVMEMQGRIATGIRWLTERTADWAPDNGFAFHNWWHLALYHLDLGETDRVLELYDTAIRPGQSEAVLEMVDATALLWRLHLRGIEVGSRWKPLADIWERMAEDAYYAFNDAHAVAAFVADSRDQATQRLLTAQERRIAGPGTNAMMTREVGLPVCRALAAFGRGDFATVVELLHPVRLIAHRFGGSHAQRDLLNLTMIEAALRGGQAKFACALIAERTSVKPTSPFNWQAAARALELSGDNVGAARARQREISLLPAAA